MHVSVCRFLPFFCCAVCSEQSLSSLSLSLFTSLFLLLSFSQSLTPYRWVALGSFRDSGYFADNAQIYDGVPCLVPFQVCDEYVRLDNTVKTVAMEIVSSLWLSNLFCVLITRAHALFMFFFSLSPHSFPSLIFPSAFLRFCKSFLSPLGILIIWKGCSTI